MAQITLTIPNNKIDDILNAFANNFNYQEFIIDQNGATIPNPVTKAEFAKSVLIDFIKDVYKSNKIRIDSQSVISTANNDSGNLNIT